MKFLMKGYMLPDATQKAEIGGSLEVKFVLGSTQLLTGNVFVFLCVVALRLRKSGPGRRQSQTGCGNQFLEPPSGPILCQIVTGKAKPLPIGLLSGFVFALSWSLGGV